jgi:predicted N-acetyltransferase YhbS
MVDWKVRSYHDGDEVGIVELQNTEPRTRPYMLERWFWRYKNNPYGFLTVVAEHDGKIVGHMAWWLLEMKFGGKKIVASQASELVVHPGYRRQGMFLAMGKALAEMAQDQGVQFTYGFPNAPAYVGHLQYGWVDVAQIPMLAGYFDTYPMIRRPLSSIANLFYRKLTKKIVTIDIAKIDRFPESINTLTENALLRYGIFVERNAKYLNWRFFQNPEQQYEVFAYEKGYVVTLAESLDKRKVGYIVDIVAEDDEAFLALTQKAIAELAKHGVDSVKCLMQPSHYLLKRVGFTFFPKRKQTLIARVNTPSFQHIYDANKRDWFITYGDCDFK